MNKALAQAQPDFTPAPRLLQRKCSCGNHTASGGECAECAGKKNKMQRKLRIGAANDPLEHEAERIAEQVMRSPAGGAVIHAPPSIQCMGSAGGDFEGEVPDSVTRTLAGSGRALDAPLRQDMEARFGRDFSGVRVHQGGLAERSAREVNARAYTVGSDVVFGAGEYAPGSQAGQRLIAHELAHVAQQGSERLEPAIRRRRVPSSAGLNDALARRGVSLARGRTGLARVLSRALAGLTVAQQTTVATAAATFGINWTSEENLLIRLSSATRVQLSSFADAIRTAAPDAELGDPLLINTGARTGTTDAANIASLVNNANSVFATISGGANDVDIGQIFGTSNVAAAKLKYSNAVAQLNRLHAASSIVTDRSGFNDEVGLGGLSNSTQILLHPTTIDNPTVIESIIIMIHESMHAGNSNVRDFGYIGQPSFTVLPETVKLTNAAHFEVVPRRILGASHAFSGQIFVPAGTSIGGVTAPALTPREQAVRGASEVFRSAWAAGLNLHTLYVRLYRTPSEWNTLDLAANFTGAAARSRFSNTLPFWSNVESLTIHTRLSSISPTGAASIRPVTLIDISLSEGLIRKLSKGMNHTPQTESAALAFESANATASEIAAASASVNVERDLLIRLVIRTKLGSITGTVNRDELVVARMAQASGGSNFTDYLRIRPPSAFP